MAVRRKGREGGYGEIAAYFRAKIASGELGPGDSLPTMRAVAELFGSTITTVNRGYKLLQEEGLTVSKAGVGTVVRGQGRARVSFEDYAAAMAPGDKGPWERATAAQGLDGRMLVETPEEVPAPADIARLLGIAEGDPVVHRRRRATIGEEVVQLQDAWYPLAVAQEAGLDAPGKIVGGILAAMNAAGLLPEFVDHHITAWVPTAEQMTELSLGSTIPVLGLERITRGRDGQVLEVARLSGAADRVELTYRNLPLTGQRTSP